MLSDKLIQILEDNNVIVPENPCSHGDGSICWELEWYSPEGEDCIWVIDGEDDESFINDFQDYADNFDVDEHVEMYVDMRGQNGVPDSIRALLDDAEAIKEKLEDITRRLSSLNK